MKLLRKNARYKWKRRLEFTPTEQLVKLKAFLICAGNSHLLKGQWDAYRSAYNLINKVNAHLKFDKDRNANRPANKISKK